MNTYTLSSLALIVSFIGSGSIYAFQGQGNQFGTHEDSSTNQVVNTCEQELILVPAITTLAISDQESLIFMREEEKLARDTYLTLSSLWGSQIFSNIANAEQQHMDSVKIFLDAYQITDPASPNSGIFTNGDLQTLYDYLIVEGSRSLIDALKVGALIEETDIEDLLNTIETTENSEISQLYTNLLNGSYNHLQAFVGQLNNLGITYIPQVLSQQQFDEILSDNQQIGNSVALDVQGNQHQSNSCILHSLVTESGLSGNNLNIKNNDKLSITSKFKPDPQYIGQTAKFLAVVNYTSEEGNTMNYSLTNNGWSEWNGSIEGLPYKQQITLSNQHEFQVFNGILDGWPGNYQLYSGYQLQNGNIIYNSQPLLFQVK